MMNDKEKYENVGETTGELILNLYGLVIPYNLTQGLLRLVNYLNSCGSSLYNFFAKNKSISTEDTSPSATESNS